MKNATLTRDTDTFSKMDPFVEGELVGIPPQKGTTTFKTNTHHGGGKTPLWEEKFTMAVCTSGKDQVKADAGLKFKVLEEDVTSNDEVGDAFVPLKDIFTSVAKAQTVKIMYKGKEAGTVVIETKWLDLKKDKSAKPIRYDGTLIVNIKSAKLTRDMDTFTKMDPVAKIELKDMPASYQGLKSFATKAHQSGGKAPVWNEKLNIPIGLSSD